MMSAPFSVIGHWDRGWDEPGLQQWARELRARLGEREVTLGLLFSTPAFFAHAKELLEIVRVHGRIPVLAGCSSYGLIEGSREHEEGNGLVLALYSLPGATVHSFKLPPGETDGSGRARAQGLDSAVITGWLGFLDPFQTDAEAWINGWQAAFPGAPIFGGLAAGKPNEPHAQVYRDGEVLDAGGVVLGFSGVRLLGAVAQGCMPVGDTWTITRVDGNIVHRIGNRPAFAVLEETFEDLAEDVKRRSRGNFFAGLVVDEYREEYQQGDFLVRNLLGADPNSGALAVAALPRPGQTLQFQLRDAVAADEDMRRSLRRLRERVGEAPVYGGCLCVCAGRGRALFSTPDHDAALVQEIIGPDTSIGGFFCNGEFGPVGSRSFVHGYTASLVLFVASESAAADGL